VAATLAVATLAFAACSSPKDVPAASSPTGGSGGASSEIAATVAKFKAKPTTIGITEPLKALPTGKKVAWIGVGTANDIAAYKSFQEAAAVLGMQATSLQAGSEVQKEVAAIEQARSEQFDAVILSALLTASIGPQLTALHDSGTKVLGYSASLEGTSSSNVDFSFYSLPEARRFGAIVADWMIEDSGGRAHVLDVFPPSAAAGVAQSDGFVDELTAKCTGCKVEKLEFAFSEVGGALPSRIVTRLQANPDINYIYGTFGAVFVGVPQALRQAGIDRIRGATVGGTPVNMQQIQGGQVLAASLDQGLQYRGYMLADAVSRLLAGQTVKSDVYNGLDMPAQLHTKDNLDFDVTKDWSGEPADFRDQFKKLWGR